MKIANWYGGKDIRIEEIPKPKIKDDEVLVKIKAASKSMVASAFLARKAR